MDENTKFEHWAIVELFGRQVIAGKVTEQTIGGTAFVRVDVPEMGDQPGFTRFYGNGAIYALTPVSEEVARMALKHHQPEPVNVYVPDLRRLTSGARQAVMDADDDDELEDPDNPF